jgi:hypothetical protein
MKIKAYTRFVESTNTHYYREFDIVDSLPEVGEVVYGGEDYGQRQTVTKISEAILDCEQGNREVDNYDFYCLTVKWEEQDENDQWQEIEEDEEKWYYAVAKKFVYCIVDNNGDVYASDIESKSQAQAKLEDIISEIGEEKAEELELEVIEQ